MKNSIRNPLLLVAIALVMVAISVGLRRSRRAGEEPRYQEHSLSEWVCFIDQSHFPDRESSFFLQTSNAIVQIGTSGAPFLVNWIRYRPTRAQIIFWSAVGQVRLRLPELPFDDSLSRWVRRDFDRADGAAVAFSILGPSAAASVPDLASIARDATERRVAQRAVYALRELGPTAYPILLEVAADTNSPARIAAMSGLGRMGTNSMTALPVLIGALNDPDDKLCSCAARVLGELALEPETVVPALVGATRHPNHIVRFVVAEALGAFGKEASSAIPALELASSDPQEYVREAATNALQVISAAIKSDNSAVPSHLP